MSTKTAGPRVKMDFEEAVRIVEASSYIDTFQLGDALQLREAQAILAEEYVKVRHRITPA